ncbi:MAG: beta-ketoacyl-[acyl-carrier-protein] synthase family protein [Candidatus Omnitrophota bacterium]
MVASKKSRVVITGLGIVSPIGIGKSIFWNNLIKGKDGIKNIESFDTTLYRTHKGGEVGHFIPKKYIRRIRLPTYCRGTQFALAASRLAVDDAGLDEQLLQDSKDRVGVIIGSATADAKMGEKSALFWHGAGYRNTPKNLGGSFNWLTVGIANSIARELNISGLSMSIPTACPSGNHVIGYALDLIRMGRLDIVLAGGTDPMNQLVFAGFNSLFVMDPQRCRPFDRERKGLVVSEGSGVVVLESLEHAKKRNTNIYAEVLGYGLSCEPYHDTGLHPSGLGMVRAVRMALHEAQISSNEIGYINAYGVGIPVHDKVETKAIKKVFGKRAKQIPVSSIKSMIGYTMGAASTIEAIACALVIKEGIIPPTINYKTPDPECDLDYVPNRARKQKVNTILSHSFGFGGNTTALLIGRFDN